MVGFAADLSRGTIVQPSPYYGQAPGAVSVNDEGGNPLTLNTHFIHNGYFSDQACSSAVTVDQIKAADAGTTFYVKVTGINGYENSLVASFEVKKMRLIFTGTAGTKVYGTAADGDIFKNITNVEDHLGTDVKATFDGKVTFTRAAGTNKGNYAITGTITDANLAKNYTIASEDITYNGTDQTFYSITAKDFTEANVEVTVTANLTYNGSAQQATIVVRDIALDQVLAENADYTIAWSNNTNAHATNPTATITGKNNYDADNIVKNFEIKAAPLLVTPHAKKVYANSAAVPGIPADVAGFVADEKWFDFQGFVDDKTAADVTWTGTTTWASDNATVNVGTYHLDLNAGNDITVANYRIIPVQGTFEIAQLPITFTANDKTIEFGDPEVYALTAAWKATAIDDDEDNLEAAIKITRASTAEASGANKGKYKLTPAYKTDSEIDTEVNAMGGLTTAQKNAKKAAIKRARDNYKGTFNVGYATVNSATLMIALKESAYTLTKVYDGQPVSITLNNTENVGVTVMGRKNANDPVDLSGLTLTVVDNAADADTYQLVLSGATAANYNITYIPSQYTITQKDLKVTTYDQVFIQNVTAATVNQTMFEIDAEKSLAAGDKASEVFKLAFSATADAAIAAGKFPTVTTYANGIEVVADGANTPKNGNYNIITTGTLGTVKVVTSTAIALDDTKDLTTVLNADADGATVTFSARALNAEQWNVLVLPFEVAVKDLYAALGYAVIDVLDENASDGNVHFRLKAAGKIAANTPFMVYPSGEIDNLNSISFTGVDVKAVTATVEKADKGGNKFVGTYKTTGIFGQAFRYMSKGTWYDARNYTESKKCNIKPLRGYLDLSGSTSAAPIIYIDEPNGEVTAINAITAERLSVEKDGWYTLNGMKLQGAPVEKGVYIRNGKKVVIK